MASPCSPVQRHDAKLLACFPMESFASMVAWLHAHWPVDVPDVTTDAHSACTSFQGCLHLAQAGSSAAQCCAQLLHRSSSVFRQQAWDIATTLDSALPQCLSLCSNCPCCACFKSYAHSKCRLHGCCSMEQSGAEEEGAPQQFDPDQDMVAYIIAAEELDNSDEERRRVSRELETLQCPLLVTQDMTY